MFRRRTGGNRQAFAGECSKMYRESFLVPLAVPFFLSLAGQDYRAERVHMMSSTFERVEGTTDTARGSLTANTIYRHKPTGMFYLDWMCLPGFWIGKDSRYLFFPQDRITCGTSRGCTDEQAQQTDGDRNVDD